MSVNTTPTRLLALPNTTGTHGNSSIAYSYREPLRLKPLRWMWFILWSQGRNKRDRYNRAIDSNARRIRISCWWSSPFIPPLHLLHFAQALAQSLLSQSISCLYPCPRFGPQSWVTRGSGWILTPTKWDTPSRTHYIISGLWWFSRRTVFLLEIQHTVPSSWYVGCMGQKHPLEWYAMFCYQMHDKSRDVNILLHPSAGRYMPIHQISTVSVVSQSFGRLITM